MTPQRSLPPVIKGLTRRRERLRVLGLFLAVARQKLHEADFRTVLEDGEAELRTAHETFTSTSDEVASALAEEHFLVDARDEAAAAMKQAYRDFALFVPAVIGPKAAAKLKVPKEAPRKSADKAKVLRDLVTVLSRPSFQRAVVTPCYVASFDAESQAAELLSVVESWEKVAKRLDCCRARLKLLRRTKESAMADFDVISADVAGLLRSLFGMAGMDSVRQEMDRELREARR